MKRVMTALALTGLGCFAGCQLERELNPALDPADLYGSVEQPADLPVPRTMRLKVGANQSRYMARGDFRSAFLLYEGGTGVDELRAFLRERLPDHGWQLRSEDSPGQERATQHWVRRHGDSGVRYLLQAQIENQGGRSRLSYDLRSTRKSVDTIPASATKKTTR